MTITLNVAPEQSQVIGPTPFGQRIIAPVISGTFSGERLKGKVLPGGKDWVLNGADGVMRIDVRLTLETDDECLIYLTYQGRLLTSKENLIAIAKGQALDPSAYSLATIAKFECGDERYKWLNTIIAVGTGEQSGFNPVYTLYEIG